MADIASPLATRSRVAPAARAIWRALGLAAATTRILVEDRVETEATAATFADRAQRTARAILYGHGIEVRTAGPKPTRPSVLVANHLSYLDPLVVASIVPCIAIAKGETQKWLLIGAGLKGLGVVFVKRGDAHSGAVVLRTVWRSLEQGAMVLNFPEGTTGDGGAVSAFRRGIFGLGRLAGVDIVPVRLRFTTMAACRGTAVRRSCRTTGGSRVCPRSSPACASVNRFGPSLPTQPPTWHGEHATQCPRCLWPDRDAADLCIYLHPPRGYPVLPAAAGRRGGRLALCRLRRGGHRCAVRRGDDLPARGALRSVRSASRERDGPGVPSRAQARRLRGPASGGRGQRRRPSLLTGPGARGHRERDRQHPPRRSRPVRPGG